MKSDKKILFRKLYEVNSAVVIFRCVLGGVPETHFDLDFLKSTKFLISEILSSQICCYIPVSCVCVCGGGGVQGPKNEVHFVPLITSSVTTSTRLQ